MEIEEIIAQELPAQKWQLAGIKLWATSRLRSTLPGLSILYGSEKILFA